MAFTLKPNDPAKAKKFFEKKLAFTTGPAELKYFMEKGEKPTVIDVRKAEDYAQGHIPGALSLPEESWSSFRGLNKDKISVVYCYTMVCHLAARACHFFANRGYPVMELEGGFETWKEYYENDVEKGEPKETAA